MKTAFVFLFGMLLGSFLAVQFSPIARECWSRAHDAGKVLVEHRLN